MLGDVLQNISILLNISSDILPNIITLIVIMITLYLTLKSSLSLVSLIPLYAVVMGILTLLGIDSVFNIYTLLIS